MRIMFEDPDKRTLAVRTAAVLFTVLTVSVLPGCLLAAAGAGAGAGYAVGHENGEQEGHLEAEHGVDED